MNIFTNNILKSSSRKKYLFKSLKYRLNPYPLFREKVLKYNNAIKAKSKEITIKRKFSGSDKHLPFIDILRHKIYEKERQNERKRQYILSKIKHNYSKKVPNNYYIMVISNLLSNKPNKLKAKYTELLNEIETKELLPNYFLLKESKIKLSYLTKLFAHNIIIFPNYLLNDKIYNIMSDYLIEKEKLIMRIENNSRINILKLKLLKYKNKNKEEIEITRNKNAIESFTDSDNIDLEDNLNNLNNDDSFDYNFGEKKNDSIKKIQGIINDISTFLNDNNLNDNEDNCKETEKNKKKIIKENKIKIKSNYLYKKTTSNFYVIKKTRTVNKPFNFNENRIIKNLITKNFLKLPLKTVDTSKEINSKYNKSEKYILNKEKIKNKDIINFKTIPNQNTDNNIYLNTIKYKYNTINTLSNTSSSRKKNFKPTNKFMYYLYQNEIIEKTKIKNFIIDLVKKFGKSINKDKENISSPHNKQKSYSINKGLTYEISKENKNNLGLIYNKNSGGHIFLDKSDSVKKNEYYYSDIFNSNKKINILMTQAQTERIQSNLNRIKPKKNSEIKVIKDINKFNIYFKRIKN